MLRDGKGVEQDYQEALKWFLKAGEKGNGRASFQAGYFFEQGLGTSPNKYEARYWYQKALNQGVEEAKEKLKN